MATAAAESKGSAPHLHRVLRLRDLILYGIIIIQPTAPMPIYGVVSQEAHGHVATAVLIAMVAMLFTAMSYGTMARAYPSAGSAYTYVGNTLHPGLGYLTGWSITMDYLLNPIICTIWCAKALGNFFPFVPFPLFAVGFALLFTALNLRGIETSARVNQWMAIGMGAVVLLFFVYAFRYLLGQHPSAVDFLKPFYNPSVFSMGALSRGTAIAVLTYIGFDGISTLAEEAENPQRNIPLATVLVCLITGVLAAIEVYAGQMIWPDYTHYPDVDTAFVHVAARAGGPPLFFIINLTLLVATAGSGMASQLGAARLLYGMGRDNVIPRSFFARVSARGTPSNNVLLSGALALIGAMLMSFQFGAELLNFGAFIAFMGVNLSAFVHGYLRGERKWSNAVFPILGFIVCFYIWLSLSPNAKIAGATWLMIGVAYGASRGNLKGRPAAPAEADSAPPEGANSAPPVGESTHREIFHQPELWADSLSRVDRHRLDLALDLPVVITGAGTSAFAAEAVAACWPGARGMATTDLLLDPVPQFDQRGGLLISLARSGNSPESAGVIERVRRMCPAVKHLAITCNAEGRLAKMPGVDVLLLDPRTNDRSRAMTSSFSNMVVAGMCLRRAADLAPVLDAIRSRTEMALPAFEEQARKLAATGVSRLTVLGGGPMFVLAREAALKILEMTGGRVAVMAETYLGLRHGPMRFLRADTPVLCFLSSDPKRFEYERDLLEELRVRKLGRIVAIGSVNALPESIYDEFVPANAPELPDELRTPFEIVYAQLLGYHLSLHYGVDPDTFMPPGVPNLVVKGLTIHEA